MPAQRRTKRKASPLSQPVAKSARSTRMVPPAIVKLEDTRPGVSDLPGELRNAVYRYGLVAQDTVDFTHNTSEAGHNLALHLPATCKAVRRETLAIFYTENTFRHTHVQGRRWDTDGLDRYGRDRLDAGRELNQPGPQRFVACIGAQNLSLIQTLQFSLHQLLCNTKTAKSVHFIGEPDYAVQVKVLPRSPYFIASLMDTDGSALSDQDKLANFGCLQPHIESLRIRGVKKLAKQELEDLNLASFMRIWRY